MAAPLDDITARHLAKVVESSDDAIVSTNLDSIITSWNRAAERICGYTAAEAVGRSIISLTVTVIGALKIARDVTERVRLQACADEYAGNTQKISDVGAMVASTLVRRSG